MKWIRTDKQLPPLGKFVTTKIEDKRGARNFQKLKLMNKLWFTPDGMYVYYTPTHWSNDNLPF